MFCYIRKHKQFITLGQERYYLENVITLANIVVRKPGAGSLTNLVRELVKRGFAIYVEQVLDPAFQKTLLKYGFVQVTEFCFISNFLGHLVRV